MSDKDHTEAETSLPWAQWCSRRSSPWPFGVCVPSDPLLPQCGADRSSWKSRPGNPKEEALLRQVMNSWHYYYFNWCLWPVRIQYSAIVIIFYGYFFDAVEQDETPPCVFTTVISMKPAYNTNDKCKYCFLLLWNECNPMRAVASVMSNE